MVSPVSPGRGGDLVFSPGRGGMDVNGQNCQGGDIVFRNAERTVEFLRIKNDGTFLVCGGYVTKDIEVYEALKQFTHDVQSTPLKP